MNQIDKIVKSKRVLDDSGLLSTGMSNKMLADSYRFDKEINGP